MAGDDFVLGDEGSHVDEPQEDWRRPVRCPQCISAAGRCVSPHDQPAVYECEVCGLQFEVDE